MLGGIRTPNAGMRSGGNGVANASTIRPPTPPLVRHHVDGWWKDYLGTGHTNVELRGLHLDAADQSRKEKQLHDRCKNLKKEQTTRRCLDPTYFKQDEGDAIPVTRVGVPRFLAYATDLGGLLTDQTSARAVEDWKELSGYFLSRLQHSYSQAKRQYEDHFRNNSVADADRIKALRKDNDDEIAKALTRQKAEWNKLSEYTDKDVIAYKRHVDTRLKKLWGELIEELARSLYRAAQLASHYDYDSISKEVKSESDRMHMYAVIENHIFKLNGRAWRTLRASDLRGLFPRTREGIERVVGVAMTRNDMKYVEKYPAPRTPAYTGSRMLQEPVTSGVAAVVEAAPEAAGAVGGAAAAAALTRRTIQPIITKTLVETTEKYLRDCQNCSADTMFDVDTPTDCLAVVKQFYPCPTHKLDINTTWPDIEEHLLPADQRDLHEEVAVRLSRPKWHFYYFETKNGCTCVRCGADRSDSRSVSVVSRLMTMARSLVRTQKKKSKDKRPSAPPAPQGPNIVNSSTGTIPKTTAGTARPLTAEAVAAAVAAAGPGRNQRTPNRQAPPPPFGSNVHTPLGAAAGAAALPPIDFSRPPPAYDARRPPNRREQQMAAISRATGGNPSVVRNLDEALEMVRRGQDARDEGNDEDEGNGGGQDGGGNGEEEGREEGEIGDDTEDEDDDSEEEPDIPVDRRRGGAAGGGGGGGGGGSSDDDGSSPSRRGGGRRRRHGSDDRRRRRRRHSHSHRHRHGRRRRRRHSWSSYDSSDYDSDYHSTRRRTTAQPNVTISQPPMSLHSEGVPIFDGNPFMYPQWRAQVMAVFESAPFHNARMHGQLINHLSGNALRLVKDISWTSPTSAHEVIDALDATYNTMSTDTRMLIQDLEQKPLPNYNMDNFNSIIESKEFVAALRRVRDSIRRNPDGTGSSYGDVLYKLRPRLTKKWCHVWDSQCQDTATKKHLHRYVGKNKDLIRVNGLYENERMDDLITVIETRIGEQSPIVASHAKEGYLNPEYMKNAAIEAIKIQNDQLNRIKGVGKPKKSNNDQPQDQRQQQQQQNQRSSGQNQQQRSQWRNRSNHAAGQGPTQQNSSNTQAPQRPRQQFGNPRPNNNQKPKGPAPGQPQVWQKDCFICGKKDDHYTAQCKNDGPKPRTANSILISCMQYNACYNCLRKNAGHRAEDCTAGHCQKPGCVRKHHTLVHGADFHKMRELREKAQQKKEAAEKKRAAKAAKREEEGGGTVNATQAQPAGDQGNRQARGGQGSGGNAAANSNNT